MSMHTIVNGDFSNWELLAKGMLLGSGFENKAWIIGNEFGALTIGLGDYEQMGLDDAVDEGRLDSYMVDTTDWTDTDWEHAEEDYVSAGNASEYFDLGPHLWMKEVTL